MKKILRHGRNSKSSGGGDGYKWIRLDVLVSTYSSPGLVPVHAVAAYTPTMPTLSSCRICFTHNPNTTIVTQTSASYFPPYPDTQPNSVFTGNGDHPHSMDFRYQSYDSSWVAFTDTVVINGLSHYVYYNNDGTKLLPADTYGPHLFYLWGYQMNAPLSNYYVLIYEGTSDDPIQNIFDAWIEGGLMDVGEFMHGDPPGDDPYIYVAPLNFNNFYNREYGGYQTLCGEIHLTPGYISDADLSSNLKVSGVWTSSGAGRVSNPDVTVSTDNGVQYINFSVDVDMSSVTSSSINYSISLEYDGTEVIDFYGTLGFYN